MERSEGGPLQSFCLLCCHDSAEYVQMSLSSFQLQGSHPTSPIPKCWCVPAKLWQQSTLPLIDHRKEMGISPGKKWGHEMMMQVTGALTWVALRHRVQHSRATPWWHHLGHTIHQTDPCFPNSCSSFGRMCVHVCGTLSCPLLLILQV